MTPFMIKRSKHFARLHREKEERAEKRLLAKYEKSFKLQDFLEMHKAGRQLASRFGWDNDHTDGLDDGEPPYQEAQRDSGYQWLFN